MALRYSLRQWTRRFFTVRPSTLDEPPRLEFLETRALLSVASPSASVLPLAIGTTDVRHATAIPTTMSLLPSSNPAAFGTSLSITAHLSATSGQPSGTITITDGTATLLVFPESGGVDAVVTTASLSAGTHTITASFDGNSTWAASSTSISLVVNPIATVTSVSIPTNSVKLGQAANFSVRTSSLAPISGRMELLDGLNVIGTTTVTPANAAITLFFNYSISTLSLGLHIIKANFTSDSTQFADSFATIGVTVTPQFIATNTSLTVTPSPDGGSDFLSASVSFSGPVGPATGTVVFSDGAMSLGTGVLNAGHATFTLGPALLPGTYSINAAYGGDSNFAASSGSFPFVVNPYSSSVGLQLGDSVAAPGAPVLLSVNVNPNGQNNANRAPSGTVAIKDGSNVLGAGTLDSTGSATFTVAAPSSGGDHSLIAYYSGDSLFAGSVSSAAALTVERTSGVRTNIQIAFGPGNNQPLGTPVSLSATVTSTGGTPTGDVVFVATDKHGNKDTISRSTLDSSGRATFAASPSTAGAYDIVGIYVGDNTFASSTSVSAGVKIGTIHQRYVQALYEDLFKRDADLAGLNAWSGALDGGETYSQVAVAITSSREYDGDVVDSFYVSYLGRHAEQGGLGAWVDQMQAGLNAEVIRAGILGSQEYYNRVGGADTSYVTALYQTFLNRLPDSGGLAAWTAILADPSKRQSVASGISNSDENRSVIITSFYVTYLHRSPDAGGLAAWKVLLANGISQPQIIAAFVTSPEYLNFNRLS